MDNQLPSDLVPVDTNIPSDLQPADTGFGARVNSYSNEAQKAVADESAAASYNPLNFYHVPLIGPAYARTVDYLRAISGHGEGDTVDDRYLNNQAYRAAVENARYNKSPTAYNLSMGTTGAITPMPELGVESNLAKAVEKTPALVKTIVPYIGKMAEAGVYGGAQAAEEAAPGTEASDLAKQTGTAALSSAILGPAISTAVKGTVGLGEKVGSYVANLFDPQAATAKQIAEAAATAPSFRPSQRGLTIAEYTDLASRGAPVTIADIHGVKPLLEIAAGKTPEDTRIQQLNDVLSDRLAESNQRIRDSVDDVFGPVNNYEARQKAQDEARRVNKPAYDAAFASPNADSILTPTLQQAANTDEGKAALAWAVNQSNKEAAITGTPPVRMPVAQNERGETVIPPFYRPDLQFWNLFKRGLDKVTQDQYSSSNASAPSTSAMTKKVVGELRNIVPEYGPALDQAKKFIRADNAYDSGANFADLLRSRNADPNEIAGHLDNFNNSYSPEEQNTFRLGLAGQIKENPDTWAKVFAQNDPQTKNRLMQVLGEDQYNGIDAAMRANRMYAMTKQVGAAGQFPHAVAHGLEGASTGLLAAAPFAIEHAPDLLQHVQDPKVLAGLGVIATVGGLVKAGSNYVDNTRADALLHMATTNDPGIRKQLIDASIKNDTFRKALEDAEGRLSRLVVTRSAPVAGQEDRMGRKSGGRVSDIDAAAAKLVREAEQTKNLISNETERMLSLPDDDIVNALSVAKRVV